MTNPIDPNAQVDKAAAFKEAVGSPAPAAQANPEDKGGAQPSVETKSTPAEPKSEPPANPQEHDWKGRYDGTAKDLKEKSEAHERAIEANAVIAKKSPETLVDLALTDPHYADEVSKKAFGMTYQEYKDSQELATIKETDPDRYETEKRIRKLESDVQKSRESSKKSFYEKKGIPDNKYDPKYQKVEEQLQLLDKDFRETNPDRALEIAYGLAFPGDPEKAAKEKEAAAAEALLKTGTHKSAGGNVHGPSTPPTGSSKSPEASAFGNKMKELVG